jgi:hypothetical protein
MNYSEILARAFKILWKFKFLWLFGIIPYLLYALSLIPAFLVHPFFGNPYSILNMSDAEVFRSMGLFFLFLLSAMVVYLFLTVLCSTATTVGVIKGDRQEGADFSFADTVRDSLPLFWRVLGVYLFFIAAIFLLMLVFMGCMGAATAVTAGLAAICVFPFFFLILPFELIGMIALEQSRAAIVADDRRLLAGLQQGWDVLKRNFLPLCLMGLILYIGLYVIVMLVSSPIYFVMMLVSFQGMSTGGVREAQQAFSNMMIAMMVFMPFYATAQGIGLTYIRSVWTLSYLRLTRKEEPPLPVEINV